jgi:hypothetical protein
LLIHFPQHSDIALVQYLSNIVILRESGTAIDVDTTNIQAGDFGTSVMTWVGLLNANDTIYSEGKNGSNVIEHVLTVKYLGTGI